MDPRYPHPPITRHLDWGLCLCSVIFLRAAVPVSGPGRAEPVLLPVAAAVVYTPATTLSRDQEPGEGGHQWPAHTQNCHVNWHLLLQWHLQPVLRTKTIASSETSECPSYHLNSSDFKYLSLTFQQRHRGRFKNVYFTSVTHGNGLDRKATKRVQNCKQ